MLPLVKERVLKDPPAEATLPVTDMEEMLRDPMLAEAAVMLVDAVRLLVVMVGQFMKDETASVDPVPATNERVVKTPVFMVMMEVPGWMPVIRSTVILSVTVMPE